MNSVSLPEQVVDYLEPNCLDGKPSGTLKKNRTARKLSDSELPTVFWMPPLSSETSESLSATVTPQAIRDWLMCLPPDSHASPSALPGKESKLTTKEICGLQQPTLLGLSNPDSYCWKMCRESVNTCPWLSETCADVGMKFDTPYSLGLTTLERPTDENECGYLPTPDCSDRRSMKSKQWGLSNYIKAGLWPTPRQSEWKGTGPVGSKSQQHMKDRNYLCAVLETGGQLNPTWVEWLMGWPLGWTDLKPLEMDKFQAWLEQHGVY